MPRKESFFNRISFAKRDGAADEDKIVEEEAGDTLTAASSEKSGKTFLNRIGFSGKREPPPPPAATDHANDGGGSEDGNAGSSPDKADKKEKKHVRINDDIESIHSNRQLSNRKSKLCTIL